MAKKYGVIDFLRKAVPDQSLQSDYDLYYPQFVDTKEPLSDLMDDDMINWVDADNSHPVFSENPDSNRVDYFDLSYGTESRQKLDIHHMKGNELKPVIIYIHGGGWLSGDKSESRYGGPTWLSMGYTVVSISYRYTLQCPFPAQIEDCAMALKWVIDNVSNYGGDPNNIAVVGHSAGGHLTALLVTGTKWHQAYGIDISKVKCWVPLSGVHDFNLKETYYNPILATCNSLLIDDPAKKDDASPVTHITGKEPPCLIIHGGDDYIVPRTNSIELYEKLTQRYVTAEFEIVKHYWHCNTVVNYGESNDKPSKIVDKFLGKYLPVSKK